ncbi:unnamed protein product [Clavelina lepadiformis]
MLVKKKLFVWIFLTLVMYSLFAASYDKYIFDNLQVLNTKWKTHKNYNSNYKNMFYFDNDDFNRDSRKLILTWEPPFGAMAQNPRHCDGCYLTYDKGTASKADAIVFHFAETWDSPHILPWKDRTPKQRWVWYCMEPPWNVRYVMQKTLTPLNGVFNWTMTYRTDSDILASYSISHKPIKKTIAEMIEGKTAPALAAWVVSNCAASVRKDFVDKLTRYISIDIYGKCSGNYLCRDSVCRNQVLSKYKFYFALENSQCKDYITEKFWNMALESKSVPVVMGPSREDYELVAPPKSFIHVDDFDSVESLAEYLKLLDENDSLYGEYLRWASATESKIDWTTDTRKVEELIKRGAKGLAFSKLINHSHHVCSLCEKLNREPPDKIEVVENLDTWWYGDDYDVNNDSFSVCRPQSGPSGFPLRKFVTLAYSAIFWFLAILLTWYLFKRKILPSDNKQV